MWWSRTRLAALWPVLVLLAACGFRLQGSSPLPAVFALTHVEAGAPNSDLARALRRSLERAGTRIAPMGGDGVAILRILEDEAGERVLSVSPTGVPEENELYHRVRYEVLSDGAQLLPPRSLTVTRDYRYDETDILGKRREAEALQAAMVDELVRLMLRRISLLQ